MLGERLPLEIALRYDIKLVLVLSFCCKVLLPCVFTEKWQLRYILYLFGGRLVCYRFVAHGFAYGQDFKIGFCGGRCSEVWQRKSRMTVASNQTKLSVSTVLNVSMSVEKWLLTGYLLKVATNCVILWNQKLWYGTLFLHNNKIKRRVLKAYILKDSIKKVVGKINLFGRAGRSPSPLLLTTCLVTQGACDQYRTKFIGYNGKPLCGKCLINLMCFRENNNGRSKQACAVLLFNH